MYFIVLGFWVFYYYLMDKFYFRDVGIDEFLLVRENMGLEVEDLGVFVLLDVLFFIRYVV